MVMGYPHLDSDDDKPHNEIVIGEVNSPWWMSQDATLVVSVINIKTQVLRMPWSLLYAVVWNLADFVLNLEDVDQLCQCCRNLCILSDDTQINIVKYSKRTFFFL
jgi:hypothetical protein